MKRALDFILALISLFISLPLWVIFSLTIWLEDKGPIFYLQARAGKDGRIFQCIKFRSMIAEAENISGPLQAKENDARITKIGKILRKIAMDELPQLWNILKGEISFVGPRALPLEEKEVGDNITRSVYDFPDFNYRCKVRPGLTGVAQIFAPRDLRRDKKFKYDIWYIKNQGFWLDIYIIILSFLITFRGRWETRNDKISFLARGLKHKIESQIG